jgi:ABC-type spermidine/putrescine transport system permease subunit II
MRQRGIIYLCSRGCAWLTYAFLLLPLAVIFPIAFSTSPYLEFPPPGFSMQWFENLFTDARWLQATVRSLQVGVVVVVLSLITGVPLSLCLARRLISGSGIIEKLIAGPLVVPTIVYAVAVYSLFGWMNLVGTLAAISLAHTVLALPFVVILVTAGLRNFDVNQELAARGLGASRLQAFMKVTLPQIAPSIYSAAFFAFITSFDELVIALFLSGYNPTLPKKIYDGIQIDIDPTVSAVCVVQIVLLLLGLLLFSRSFRSAANVDY